MAILMVLTLHFIGNTMPTNWVENAIIRVANYGSYGVELFFVLSGFLITGILFDARDQPQHYFRNFYMRRFLRIFPLYYGVLILVFFVCPLVPALRGPTLSHLLDHQAWAWLYAVNIYIAMNGDWALSYLEHFWSLAIEEHFYLFWPVVVFLFARRPQVLMAITLAIVLCAYLARQIGFFAGLSWWTLVVLTPFRLDGLALGAFLAVALRQPGGLAHLMHALPRVVLTTVGLLAATYVWTGPLSAQGMAPVLPLRTSLVQVLLACLLLWALVAPERSLAKRFFCCRPMIFLGTYSYGLYVYHHFISYYFSSNRTEFALAQWLGSHAMAVFLQATLGVSGSLAVAYISYEFFEKYFLRLKMLFHSSSGQTIEPYRSVLETAAHPERAPETELHASHWERTRVVQLCVVIRRIFERRRGV